MREAGFEPAHPEITELKPVALDHSAIRAFIVTLSSQTFLDFHFRFLCIFFWVLLKLGPNNASITRHTHTHTHLATSLALLPVMYSHLFFKSVLHRITRQSHETESSTSGECRQTETPTRSSHMCPHLCYTYRMARWLG